MKKLTTQNFEAIKAGEEIITKSVITSKTILRYLEREEKHIFWLQPHSGTIQEQIPALKVNGVYYSLNLKMEKAAFRNVRLTRKFLNVECLENGIEKLRIPTRLFKEKQRTSRRAVVIYFF